MQETGTQENIYQTEIRRLLDGYRITQMIYVAAELGLADLMKDGFRHYEDLAAASGANPRALYRLLRALASAGIFDRQPGDYFGLTPLGETLRTGIRGSMHASAILTGSHQYQTWGHLLETLRTGETTFDSLYKENVWQYRERYPEQAKIFNDAMSEMMILTTQAVVKAYDFSRFHTVVDVGGGQGSLLIAILQAYPSIRGILYDQSKAIQEAQNLVEAAGLTGRCQLVAGSFFESVPAGGDCYLLSRIIHDWDDEKAAQILRNCRAAMQPEQQLLIVEQPLDSENPSLTQALIDLHMMVMTGGIQRTNEEYQDLLSASGFHIRSFISTGSSFQIVEGTAV